MTRLCRRMLGMPWCRLGSCPAGPSILPSAWRERPSDHRPRSHAQRDHPPDLPDPAHRTLNTCKRSTLWLIQPFLSTSPKKWGIIKPQQNWGEKLKLPAQNMRFWQIWKKLLKKRKLGQEITKLTEMAMLGHLTEFYQITTKFGKGVSNL